MSCEQIYHDKNTFTLNYKYLPPLQMVSRYENNFNNLNLQMRNDTHREKLYQNKLIKEFIKIGSFLPLIIVYTIN